MKLSALSLSLSQTGVPANHFLIFPEGDAIKAKDGRPFDAPAWIMKKDNGMALAASLNQSAKDLVIDYEHQTILSKENGQPASIDPKADNDTLRKFMAEVLPDYDRDRVYPSDIRKLISWYNLLINNKSI